MKWQLDQFRGKDIVFVGAGKGRALAGVQAFLSAHGNINSFAAIDKQDNDNPLEFLTSYDAGKTVFIKNEAVPGSEMPVSYYTPLQLFFELVGQCDAVTVGITGTKGKSTTAALTAHILQSAGKDVVLAGNIGQSPLSSLDKANTDTIFVLELSSYQLSDLAISPHISACLNLYNDHTDWHGSLDGYWEAKHNIMRYASAEDIFIYNPDFPELKKWATTANCKTIAIDKSTPLDLSHAQLFGEHNRLNALVAREIAHQFDISDHIISGAIDSFTPLKHRMQLVATVNKRTYIDDGIGMTPESTLASLTAISQKYGHIGCVLLGGQDRNYHYKNLMTAIAKLQVPALVLFPDTAQKMKEAFPATYTPHILETTSMETAVKWASRQAPIHTTIVLSTAAPSYSLWKDFEEKGDQFQRAISRLTS